MAAGFAAVDVMKTRLQQVAEAKPSVFWYHDPVDYFLQLMRTEGPKSLFAGLTGRGWPCGYQCIMCDLLKSLYLTIITNA